MSVAALQRRPGRLVLVVGPSGAGKDTLIRAARERLANDERYLFPRRIVTRPASPAEDNFAVDEATFARMAAAGEFAVQWAAHGLSYGIPATIDGAIEAGRSVVCNVSRTTVADLRARFDVVQVVEVTAPPDILAARLADRRRPQDGDPYRRLARSDRLEPVRADVTVLNASSLEEACAAFFSAITVDDGRAGNSRDDARGQHAAIR